ncbi:hypothetical protein CUS80_00325 [Enterococcus faecium]|nr:hypothetical protein CUS80_00325 [Enterococcus faecium]
MGYILLALPILFFTLAVISIVARVLLGLYKLVFGLEVPFAREVLLFGGGILLFSVGMFLLR